MHFIPARQISEQSVCRPSKEKDSFAEKSTESAKLRPELLPPAPEEWQIPEETVGRQQVTADL